MSRLVFYLLYKCNKSYNYTINILHLEHNAISSHCEIDLREMYHK
jgi:hypothetical protein